MATDVFRIQGVVEVVADRAQRSLIVFRQQCTNTANSVRASFRGLDGLLGSFSGFFTGLQFKRLAEGILKASMTAETFRVQMNLIVRDMAKVKDLTSWMVAYEVKTPFNLPEIQQATVLFTKLTKIRGEDLNKAKEYITLAGEMASIFNKPLAKATEGLFKTLSGSALGLTILRNNFAITKAELEKYGVAFDQSGRIKNFQMQLGTVEHAIKSIIGHLGHMEVTEARAQTLQGRLESLHSQIFAVSVLMGDKLAPVAMTVVNRMIEMSQAIQDLIKKYPMMANAIAIMVGFGAVLGTLLVALGPIIFFGNQLITMIISLGSYVGGTSLLLRMFQFTLLPIGTVLSRIFSVMAGAPAAFGGLVAFFTELVAQIRFLTAGFAFMGTSMGTLEATWFVVSSSMVTGIGNIVAALGAGLAAVVTWRAALYGMGGAALYALLKLKEYTDYLDAETQAEDLKNKVRDPKASRSIIEEVLGKNKAVEFDRGEQNRAVLEAERKRLQAIVDSTSPENLAQAKKYSQSELKERLATVEREMPKNNKPAEISTAADDAERKARADAFKESSSGMMAGWSREEQAQNAADRLNDWTTSPVRAGLIAYGEAPVTAAQVLAAVDAQEKLNAALEGGGKFVKFTEDTYAKIPDWIKEQIRLTGVAGQQEQAAAKLRQQIIAGDALEKLGRGKITPEQYKEWYTELQRKAKMEILTGEQVFHELVKKRKEILEDDGKTPRKGFGDLIKKSDQSIHDFAGKALDGIVAQAKSNIAMNPEGSIHDRLQINLDAQKAIKRIPGERAKALGTESRYTAAEAKALNVLERDIAKDQTLRYENQKKAEREITGFTQSEFAKRRDDLDKVVAGWVKDGLTEVQIAKKTAHEKALIRADELASHQAFNDKVLEVARVEDATALATAEGDLARGGNDFAAKKAAQEEIYASEDINAKGKLARDIEDVKLRGHAGIFEGEKTEKVIENLKKKFAADQAARDVDRKNQRISDEEAVAQKADSVLNRKGSIKVKGYNDQLTQLQEQQAGGADTSDQIIQVLRNRYQTEMAMILSKAEADKDAARVANDKEAQLAIEQEKTQAILDLTRSTTAEVQKQLALKKAAEDKKKNSFFFAQGTMSAEEYDKMDKARSDDMRSKYKQSVLREQMRTGGVSKETRDAANKLGVDSSIQNAAFNPNAVEIKPIDINVKVDLVDPNGKTTTVRKATSTEAKNTQTKNSSTQRGKPWDFRPTEGYPEGVA